MDFFFFLCVRHEYFFLCQTWTNFGWSLENFLAWKILLDMKFFVGHGKILFGYGIFCWYEYFVDILMIVQLCFVESQKSR